MLVDDLKIVSILIYMGDMYMDKNFHCLLVVTLGVQYVTSRLNKFSTPRGIPVRFDQISKEMRIMRLAQHVLRAKIQHLLNMLTSEGDQNRIVAYTPTYTPRFLYHTHASLLKNLYTYRTRFRQVCP
jgi:hypothetical protein